MKNAIRVAILAIMLAAAPSAGCAPLQKAYDLVTEAKVSPTAVYIAANSFNALEATATNYLTLPRCPKANICRSPAATKKIIPAVRSGRDARNQLEAFYAAHPGELGPKGAYDALIASTNLLKSIYAKYGVN